MKLKKVINYIGAVRICLFMLLFVGLALKIAAEKAEGFAEWYAEKIYSKIAYFFGSITGIIPFSLAEVLFVTVPLIILIYAAVIIIRLIKRQKGSGKSAGKFILNILCTVAVCLFLFETNCGINYYRLTSSEIYNLEMRKVSADELCEVCIKLADGAAEAREKIINDNFVDKNTPQKTNEAVNRLAERYPALAKTGAKPKSVILSRGMSYMNITGVYFPYTFEANVNADVPAHTIPATMCHELAHTCGIMREDEANFTSFLACIESGEPEIEYSGYMLAFAYASNALYKADREKYYIVSEHITDKMRKDMDENNEYWKQFETPAAEAASAVNNNYLKANSQEDGVRSYGRITDLVIAYYSQTD